MNAVIAYVPVLHQGYLRFIERNAIGRPFYVVGADVYYDYRPLAKDIRAIDPSLAASSIAAWGLCSEVDVLDIMTAEALAQSCPSLVLPAEDVSYQVVERFFSRCEVSFDSVFLRWDKTRSALQKEPSARSTAFLNDSLRALWTAAHKGETASVDWWRRVGAAVRFADGEIQFAGNEHQPHRLSPYVVGDPRSNFFKGVHIELSTATHAEARLIATAARDGRPTVGAEMFVTDFPCPPCARLIADAGFTALYFSKGYAMLDGEDILDQAGVDVVRMIVEPNEFDLRD
jgi:dCMP deaminase